MLLTLLSTAPSPPPSQFTVCTSRFTLLPALLQKLVGEFFFDFSQGNLENLVGNLEGIFRGIFLIHRTKAQNFRGKFRSIFRKKIRGSKKIFRAKFTLQTCHLNGLRALEKMPLLIFDLCRGSLGLQFWGVRTHHLGQRSKGGGECDSHPVASVSFGEIAQATKRPAKISKRHLIWLN